MSNQTHNPASLFRISGAVVKSAQLPISDVPQTVQDSFNSPCCLMHPYKKATSDFRARARMWQPMLVIMTASTMRSSTATRGTQSPRRCGTGKQGCEFGLTWLCRYFLTIFYNLHFQFFFNSLCAQKI